MNHKGTWTITVRSAEGEPREYALKPGTNTIGRSSKNDIVITDVSSSRHHAEIHYEPGKNIVNLQYLKSTNGTFVNRNRLDGTIRLGTSDIIRIGTVLLTLNYYGPSAGEISNSSLGTRPLTRELLVESFDQHAALMYEVASQLNSVLDIDMALSPRRRRLRRGSRRPTKRQRSVGRRVFYPQCHRGRYRIPQTA